MVVWWQFGDSLAGSFVGTFEGSVARSLVGTIEGSVAGSLAAVWQAFLRQTLPNNSSQIQSQLENSTLK